MLTKRQKQVLDFITDYQKRKGYAPSLEDVRKKFKLASVSTAHFHIKKLGELGYLKKEDNKPRSISVYKSEQMIQVPFLGLIAAGQPIEAIQTKETIAIPKNKLPKNGNFYALRVAGNSMIEENINDGDIVLVKQQSTAENGQKVVALIDNYEATLKTFFKERKRVRLQPANKDFEPIIIKSGEREVSIQGLVIDVIKNIEAETEQKTKRTDTLLISELSKKKKVALPLNKIICGDVIDELKKIPSESVDLIIADPPYWKVINEKWDYQWRLESDYINWSNQWFEQVYRILRKGGSFYVFGYFRMLALLLDGLLRLGFDLRQQIIIDKGMRSVSGRATKNYKMFPNVTESILFLTKDSKPFIKNFLKERQQEKGYSAKEINELLGVKSNGGGMWSIYTGENVCEQTPTRELWEKLSDVLDFDLPYEEVAMVFNPQMGLTDVWKDVNFYKEDRHHPTQKPVSLIERLIIASSHEGMVVLDPFLGAGSTVLACINLKRNYIGIDIDEKYINISKQRAKTLKNTLTLF